MIAKDAPVVTDQALRHRVPTVSRFHMGAGTPSQGRGVIMFKQVAHSGGHGGTVIGAHVAAAVAGMNFNIDYIYGSAHPESPRKLLVLRSHSPGIDAILDEVSQYIEEHY